MTQIYRFRYTAEVVRTASEDSYPADFDPTKIEIANAEEVLIDALENGEAEVNVEVLDEQPHAPDS